MRKSCENCLHYDRGSCLLTGNGTGYQRHFGWFKARLKDTCGREGRWFNDKPQAVSMESYPQNDGDEITFTCEGKEVGRIDAQGFHFGTEIRDNKKAAYLVGTYPKNPILPKFEDDEGWIKGTTVAYNTSSDYRKMKGFPKLDLTGFYEDGNQAAIPKPWLNR